MADLKLSRCGTQIDHLPSGLTIDILSRLPIETLVKSRFVCKSWFFLFSDPMFVRLHSARSPTCLLSRSARLKRDLKRYKSVGAMVDKDFQIDTSKVRTPAPDSRFCYNSCHGIICLRKVSSVDEIYVCNPISGEYVTIPALNKGSILRIRYVLGFCSRSNQFKVLKIYSNMDSAPSYMAEIYTIGTRQWREIGIAPSCTILKFNDDSSFLNGSIHWADEETRKIVYFDFESDRFGSLPGPPAWCDGRWLSFSEVKVGVSDGCLCIYAFGGRVLMEKWVMKEYGVEESWTDILSTHNNNNNRPSFISLQDVAESEHLTVLSKTRTKDEDCPEVISNTIFQLWE